MTRARLARPLALVGAAIAGAVLAVSLRGGASAPAAPAPPPLTTATIARADLRTSVLTGGTLGYAPAPAPVINGLSGTYTELPPTGRTIARGQTLYRVDDFPAVLLVGDTPAWREFALGMTAGPDVSELQSNLIALGYARGLLSAPTGRYDWLTAAAVERWQEAEDEPVTGAIALGDVIFLPSAIRVGAESQAPGQAASPGQAPYQATSTTRAVVVPLDPNLPAAGLAERVSIVLPSGATTPGRIVAVGPAPVGSAGTAGAHASSQLTVTPDRPAATGTGAGIAVQVSLTTSSVRGVLAAPVSALLALASGGYGVEVVMPSGAHRLVGVRTGMFAGSRVQVTGADIQPGTRVVVAQ